MPVDVSLAILAFNEEQQIQSCIESGRLAADEIVVLDSGSTDRTVEMAEELGARVFSYTWQDDFAHARNELKSRCSGRWIVMLDADEMLSPESDPWWKDSQRWESADAWWCRIVNQRSAEKQNDYSHRLPRFFRNTEQLYFKFPIHENLDLSGVTTGDSPVVIYHYGYDRDRYDQEAKRRRNYRLLQKRREQYPEDAYTDFYLAQHFSSEEEAEQAYRYALNALRKSIDGSAGLMCLRMAWEYVTQNELFDATEDLREVTPEAQKFPEIRLYEARLNQQYDPEVSRDKLRVFLDRVEQLDKEGKLYRTETVLPEAHRDGLQLYMVLHFNRLGVVEAEELLQKMEDLGGIKVPFLASLLKQALQSGRKQIMPVLTNFLSKVDIPDNSQKEQLLQRINGLQELMKSYPQTP